MDHMVPLKFIVSYLQFVERSNCIQHCVWLGIELQQGQGNNTGICPLKGIAKPLKNGSLRPS
jgi:hypothetical protein